MGPPVKKIKHTIEDTPTKLTEESNAEADQAENADDTTMHAEMIDAELALHVCKVNIAHWSLSCWETLTAVPVHLQANRAADDSFKIEKLTEDMVVKFMGEVNAEADEAV